MPSLTLNGIVFASGFGIEYTGKLSIKSKVVEYHFLKFCVPPLFLLGFA